MSATTITVTRTVAAAPERVFDAWTEVDQLASWWWPQLAGTTYDVDARVGGGYRIASPALGVSVTGVYTEVDRPHRLVFSWRWDDGAPEGVAEDTVVVTFERVGEATVVTVAHTSDVHEPEGGAAQGWNDVVDRLVARYASTSSRS